jgi:hypothetical protein
MAQLDRSQDEILREFNMGNTMATVASIEQKSELVQENTRAICDLKCKSDRQFIGFLNALFLVVLVKTHCQTSAYVIKMNYVDSIITDSQRRPGTLLNISRWPPAREEKDVPLLLFW